MCTPRITSMLHLHLHLHLHLSLIHLGQQLKELQKTTSYKEAKADDDDHGYVETDPTGRYARFDEVLGKGAIKTVYRAIDEVLGMEVAWNQVKLNHMLQSPEELQRLYSEVHLLSTLNHDSIIRFYTSWIDVDHKSFNFITEMFTSGTLRQYRTKYRRIDIRAIKSWARQILRGLVYLHGHDPPVIHRDLKCDNIFVNGHLAQVKIGDLGLAAILRGSQSAHSVIGTPEFMAPELYEEDYNELVDVYAFGMCVLEMLTSEFPYSECTNPAQIYKKVTLGKLPEAYHRIHDEEARNFVGKCLQSVSERPSAKQLLVDPFLSSDEAKMSLLAELSQQKSLLNDLKLDKLPMDHHIARTKMSITGKLNAEDDAIFLKVQIADIKGAARNIFFPFDIVSDTPLDVAMEMVKELEIDDWEPFEIADKIDGEISALVPIWRKWDQPTSDHQEEHDTGGHIHPLHSHSSSPSQSSASTLIPFLNGSDWLQDDTFDETSSQSSSMSGKYSNFNYFSGNEHEYSEVEPVAKPQKPVVVRTHSFTRFGQSSNSNSGQSLAREAYKQSNRMVASNGASDTRTDKSAIDRKRLERNNSLLDVRSQLLHQSLVEEVHKRRLSRTVGAVEHIGFQAPYDVSRSPGVTSRRATKEGKVSRNGR